MHLMSEHHEVLGLGSDYLEDHHRQAAGQPDQRSVSGQPCRQGDRRPVEPPALQRCQPTRKSQL